MSRKHISLVILMCGILLFVSGCHSNKENAPTLKGTWVFDFSQSPNVDSSSFKDLTGANFKFPHSISFYEDGTYTMNLGYINGYGVLSLSEEWNNGNYAVVHDGSTLAFDGSAYYSFDFWNDSLRITGESGNVYVYNKNDSSPIVGYYRICEADGHEADITSAFLVVFREDHLITNCLCLEDNFEFSDLFVSEVWEMHDDQLIFRSTDSGETNFGTFDGDKIFMEIEGQYVTLERVFIEA